MDLARRETADGHVMPQGLPSGNSSCSGPAVVRVAGGGMAVRWWLGGAVGRRAGSCLSCTCGSIPRQMVVTAAGKVTRRVRRP